ncbi:hypothetical protein Bca52824_062089 [Brassica carinata]|uniref:Uncharacterized protein n=1 Tax=Brassica carinata TaxID=52824 RepID=A0A8X7QHD7_BRACI|nr:hypothetical protein Bca52824_062089 [Brassica carinata]
MLDEVVVTPLKRAEIAGVNDAITRGLLLKCAVISIYCVARGWESVIAYKEEMSFIYVLIKYFGFFSMYIYVFRLACCFMSSDYPPHTTFRGRVTLLTIISLMVNVSMFCICYKWQRWESFSLTLGVFIAALSLVQLIYGLDGLGASFVSGTATFGSAWGINGLYFDSCTPGLIGTFILYLVIINVLYTRVIYDDKVKSLEKNLVALIKIDMER